jgi:hypothetical protein
MTVTYPNGTKVQCLALTADADVCHVVVPGDNDVRVFRRIDGVWRTEDGQLVQLSYAGRNEGAAPAPDESHFTCTQALGKQIISRLMNGSGEQEGAPGPFYVFSSENQQVHITVLRAQHSRAS